jgi:protoporphyrin/coproporphyrin ferrochelatase
MPNRSTSKSNAHQLTGVVIMTYGSATTAEHVADYMHHIYGDKASPETIADFEDRYARVGHSPLIEITLDQAKKLQDELGENYVVRAGMLHSQPFIGNAVGECQQAGATRLIGIVLSPQFSSFIMDGYRNAFNAAATTHHFKPEAVSLVGPWPAQSHFIELLAERTKAALVKLTAQYGASPAIVFTTHSLPERVVAQDPSYLKQLTATTEAVLTKLGQPEPEWYSAYQSAGHTPEPWLKPDLTDILAALRAKHHAAVLIVPIQFLADHLEILYDLDIAGAEQCHDFGLAYHRIELPNTDPLFIKALAALARDAKFAT